MEASVNKTAMNAADAVSCLKTGLEKDIAKTPVGIYVSTKLKLRLTLTLTI